MAVPALVKCPHTHAHPAHARARVRDGHCRGMKTGAFFVLHPSSSTGSDWTVSRDNTDSAVAARERTFDKN